MQKTLDQKLARIVADSTCNDFILADAKDADMAYGLAAPGLKNQPTDDKSPFKSIQDYRANIRAVVEQGLVDIMLMSVSTSDALTVGERLFENSPITPAIRANDTSCLWLYGTQAAYCRQPSRPFRTAIIDEAIGANANGLIPPGQPQVNLGLYSMTLNNDVDLDHAALMAFLRFSRRSLAKGLPLFPRSFSSERPR